MSPVVRVSWLAPLAVMPALAGCFALATFDTVPDASCADSVCEGGSGIDVTVLEGGQFDGPFFGDGGDGTDGPDAAALCSLLAQGEPCAKATTCSGVATCEQGVCTPHPMNEGMTCGSAPPNECLQPSVCVSGLCAAAQPVEAGTQCGETPDAACYARGVCASGVCGPAVELGADASCGPAPDKCHGPPTCANGACGTAPTLADGTPCGSAPDGCHDAPTCKSGNCGTAAEKPNGTAWGSGGTQMCCGGAEVTATSDQNCGVCGWTCGSGQSCNVVDGYYFCTGCTSNGACASGCCSGTGTYHCSPSNCDSACESPTTCTDGSHCVAGSTVDYCAY